MNKCKLIKPVPVMGRVLPVGMMVDAPDAYKNKLVAEGKAVWVEGVQVQANNEGSRGESHAPNSVVPKQRASRKKVL